MAQRKPHAPLAQVAVAFAGAEHTVPHAPQLFASVASSRQPVAHAAWVPLHTKVHAPATHDCPAAQLLPHAPQWIVDVARVVSQPLLASLSQLP